MATPRMGEFPVRDNLPISYYRDIGRIIFQWARFENELRNVLYVMLNIGRKEGRIAISTPRAEDIAQRIIDLISIKKLDTNVKLKEFKEAVQILRSARDNIAHGIWVDHPNSRNPVLQRTSGSTELEPGKKKVSARIFPGSINVGPGHMRETATAIEHLIRITATLRLELRDQIQVRKKE